MIIEHEANISQRAGSEPNKRCDVKSFENRINTDEVAVTDDVREIYRLTFHQNEIDLGMRHAQRFDHVLDRNRVLERIDEFNLSFTGWQEIIQLCIESKEDGCHGGRSKLSRRLEAECRTKSQRVKSEEPLSA